MTTAIDTCGGVHSHYMPRLVSFVIGKHVTGYELKDKLVITQKHEDVFCVHVTRRENFVAVFVVFSTVV